jgi:hypothetical protein
MKTQNIQQAVYDVIQRSFTKVEKDDCGRLFVTLCDCEIQIEFLGENNQEIQMQMFFPTLTSKRLVQFAYDACLALNPSSLSKLLVVPVFNKKEAITAILKYTCYSEEDATDFLCEGLNIMKATRMQVFEFMDEYFSLDAEKENEIEAIISDIPGLTE